jgi:hypothetical protein
MAKMYAWSDIYNGGKVEEITLPNGGKRKVVVERNIIPHGSEVSKAKSKLDSEDWDRMVANGSIRPYPMPEEADDNTSPNQAVLRRLYKGEGEIDQNLLLELALSQPASDDEAVEEHSDAPIGA